MSTRAQIILTDSDGNELRFYKHWDGYPEETLPILEDFVGAVRQGRIRDNVEQAAGWLILLGEQERRLPWPPDEQFYDQHGKLVDNPDRDNGSGFRCLPRNDNDLLLIEPCCEEHEDIDYYYTVDLSTKQISVRGA